MHVYDDLMSLLVSYDSTMLGIDNMVFDDQN
jgi:hypothetical protein